MNLSFYLLDVAWGRQKRVWLQSVDHEPTDWFELRRMIEEVMRKVHMERGDKEVTILTLERHLPGRSFSAVGSHYRQFKVPFRREYEAIFKIEYNEKTGELTLKDSQFGPSLSQLRTDYWRMEKGIQWRSPPAIPRQHRDPLDPKGMVMEVPATRYPDYSRRLRMHYEREEEEKPKPRTFYARDSDLSKNVYG